MSAQRYYQDARQLSAMPAYEQFPGGYRSPNNAPAVPATVVQVATSAPNPLLVPRSQGTVWAWPLGGAIAMLALAGSLQMATLSAEHQLKDVKGQIADTRSAIVQERHSVAEAMRVRNELAATIIPDPQYALEAAVIYVPAQQERAQLASLGAVDGGQ